MEDISLRAAFSGSLLSFETPCVVPLVPVYLASLAGPGILKPKVNKICLPIFFDSVSFVLGFSLVFTMMGALVGLAKKYHIRGIPTTYFVDKDGIIQVIKISTFQTKEEIEASIRIVIE